jgi:hypothetical protein
VRDTQGGPLSDGYAAVRPAEMEMVFSGVRIAGRPGAKVHALYPPNIRLSHSVLLLEQGFNFVVKTNAIGRERVVYDDPALHDSKCAVQKPT